MSKISELSDGGSLVSSDYLIAVRSGGNVKVRMDQINVDQVDLGDNEFIRLGNSQDLTMVHTPTQSIINQAGIGDLLLQKAGATKLTINASGIDVTGSVTADGLTVEANSGGGGGSTTPVVVVISDTDTGSSWASGDIFAATDYKSADGSGAGSGVRVRTGISQEASAGSTSSYIVQTAPATAGIMVDRLKISSGGDISFYEDTGTTPKMVWSSSDESLNLSSNSAYVVTNSGRAVNGLDIAGAEGSLGSYGGAISLGNGRTGRSAIAAVQGHATDGDANGLAFFTHASSGSTADSIKRMEIAANGDISFYNTAGNSQALFWDASAESLGIGTTGSVAFSDGSGLRIERAATATLRLQDTDSHGFEIRAAAGAAEFFSANSKPFTFSSATSELMRLDASGNLLVGKTATGFGTAGIELYNADQIYATSTTHGLAVNRLSTDGDIAKFYKDNTTVGSIGSASGVISYIVLDPRSSLKGAGLIGGSIDSSTGVLNPADKTGAAVDGAIQLGIGSKRFKSLYLSDGVYLGGVVAANLLSDYEEGTWTPAYTPTTGTFTTITTVSTGRYTKVGRLVTLFGSMRTSGTLDVTGASGNLKITGLPFACNSTQGAGGPDLGHQSWNLGTDILNTRMSVAAGASELLMFKNTMNGSSFPGGNITVSEMSTSGGTFSNLLTFTASYEV